MNYYDKHIGDYIRDTVSLSMLEDGAYNRLLDQVYQTERALPLDKKEVYRVARATSPAERKAVDYVLGKFFHVTDDGYMQKRAQILIEEYWDRQPAEESKRESAKVRQQRARARRQSLFDQLREHGIVPEFNTPSKQLELALSRVTSSDSHAPVTRDDTLTQPPLPNHQTPKEVNHPTGDSTEVGPRPPEGGSPTRIGEICILLRGYGINTSPNALAQHTWPAHADATDQLLHTAVAEAKESNNGGRLHVNYLKPIIERLLHPPEPKAPKSDEWAWSKTKPGIEAKGRELGMFARGSEDHYAFAERIKVEIRKRKGTKP